MKIRSTTPKIYLTNMRGAEFPLNEIELPPHNHTRLEFLRKLMRESGCSVSVRYYDNCRPAEYQTHMLLEARITRDNGDGSYDVGWKRDYWIEDD